MHLSSYLRKAGFAPVSKELTLPDFGLYRFSPEKPLVDLESLPIESWKKDFQSVPTVMYFWMAGCDICDSSLRELNRWQKFQKSWNLRLVVLQTDLTAFIRDEASRLKLTLPLYVDGNGALAQMLSVRASPTIFVLDSQHRVMGRADRSIQFDSPEMETLANVLEKPHSKPQSEKGFQEHTVLSFGEFHTQGALFAFGIVILGIFLAYGIYLKSQKG